METSNQTAHRRSRLVYGGLIGATIASGLASRSELAGKLPDFVASYAGDTLWALMLFFVLAFVFPHARPGRVAAWTLGMAFAVEISQLYQAEWIEAVRDTRLGALVLGHGFLWSDLACYTAGVAVGYFGELVGHRRGARS